MADWAVMAESWHQCQQHYPPARRMFASGSIGSTQVLLLHCSSQLLKVCSGWSFLYITHHADTTNYGSILMPTLLSTVITEPAATSECMHVFITLPLIYHHSRWKAHTIHTCRPVVCLNSDTELMLLAIHLSHVTLKTTSWVTHWTFETALPTNWPYLCVGMWHCLIGLDCNVQELLCF